MKTNIINTRLKHLLNELLLLLTVVLLNACGRAYSDEDLAQFDREIQVFLKENNWNAERSESGLYLEIIEEGTGQPIPFDAKVLVTYKGSLLNGQSFDQTGVEPVMLQTRTLIAGWREALLSLNVGSSVRMVIPPNLGYKNQELPKIPKNSILVFELKVHDIQ
jgi:FKBP-type peptidyl-prolyl cis-trans isomerase FkpA